MRCVECTQHNIKRFLRSVKIWSAHSLLPMSHTAVPACVSHELRTAPVSCKSYAADGGGVWCSGHVFAVFQSEEDPTAAPPCGRCWTHQSSTQAAPAIGLREALSPTKSSPSSSKQLTTQKQRHRQPTKASHKFIEGIWSIHHRNSNNMNLAWKMHCKSKTAKCHNNSAAKKMASASRVFEKSVPY